MPPSYDKPEELKELGDGWKPPVLVFKSGFKTQGKWKYVCFPSLKDKGTAQVHVVVYGDKEEPSLDTAYVKLEKWATDVLMFPDKEKPRYVFVFVVVPVDE